MESDNVIRSVIKHLGNHIQTKVLITMFEQDFAKTMNSRANSLANISEI